MNVFDSLEIFMFWTQEWFRGFLIGYLLTQVLEIIQFSK